MRMTVEHERIIDDRDGLPVLRAVPDGVLTDDIVRRCVTSNADRFGRRHR